MSKLLTWFNGRWIYDSITFREYEGIQPPSPKYKGNMDAIYRREKVKIIYANCTIKDDGTELIWYDVAKENHHSVMVTENELSPIKE